MSERKAAPWMCPLDERIMEYLNRESWSTAPLIEQATTMNASEGRVRERLELLSRAELVAPVFEDRKMYEITGMGQRYLKGELDVAKHVERPNPPVAQTGSN